MLHAIEINERLNALVFSEDGNYLITGGTGRLVVVRDIRQSLAVVSRINGSMKTYDLVDREVLAPPCSHLLNLFCFLIFINSNITLVLFTKKGKVN
jgi:hypothetical protein